MIAVDYSSQVKGSYLSVNPSIGMETENGATRHELQEKSSVLLKRMSKLLSEVERNESKKLKGFQESVEQVNQRP